MIVLIESLDQEGRGVARNSGKVIFVRGALPGEVVDIEITQSKSKYDLAALKNITQASFMRVAPRCQYFERCGGCSLQHLEAGAQVAVKQRVLEDNLWHLGKIRALTIAPPIYGPAWGYRHRARLSVRHVAKKGGVLVGFHERQSRYVTEMRSCEILPPRISRLIYPLRVLLDGLSVRDKIPQVEVTLSEASDIFILRVLMPLSNADNLLLKAFANTHHVEFYVQAHGPESVQPLEPANAADAYYTLPEFNLQLYFLPTQFTQVNPLMNRMLVNRAMCLLDPQPGERIADMFCGIGNFTLPIARRGADVTGVEGSGKLVTQAQKNAQRNSLAANFIEANLFAVDAATLLVWGSFDKMLVDPPRDGAMALFRALTPLLPRRILYVSCNPATLARDADFLVNELGYTLTSAGVINMFPHTAHVESIALFDLR